MAPTRKSTSKKKATTSALSRVRKRPHAGTIHGNNAHMQPDPRVRNLLNASNGTFAQNDVPNLTTSGERSNEDSSRISASCCYSTGLVDLPDPHSDDVVVIDDDEPSDSTRVVIDLTQEPGPEPRLEKKDIFPFLKLPSEIRNQVYLELIPSCYEIFYGYRNLLNANGRRVPGLVTARDKNGVVYSRWVRRKVEIQGFKGPRTRVVSCEQRFPPVVLNVFLLNKFICNEARAVLYGKNTFNFNINAVAKKYDESKVFGLFADPARKHLLRELRLITLLIDVNDGSHLAITRHRERLHQFMQELQKYSHDSEHKSLLKRLKVDWFATSLYRSRNGGLVPMMPRVIGIPDAAMRSADGNQKNYIFGLEGLTALSGVEEVEINGAYVPSWFIECLTRCLKGSAEAPPPINYPELVVRKKNRDKGNGARRTYKYVAVSTKKWCDPWLNWTEFAEKEGIEVPEIDRFRLQGLRC